MENKLLQIQMELKAPKDLDNKFANYKYRSCESILEALKPLLIKQKCELTLSDEVVLVGNRVYVKATATLIDDPHRWIVTAFAREEEIKKGMDSSQITGAASSYARKYALNGLFLIDDTKDSDHTNTGESKEPEHKHVNPASMAPTDLKIVTGKISNHILATPPNKWHKFVVNNIELSTQTDMDIETLIGNKENDETVSIEYAEVVKGKWTNRYIKSIAIVTDEMPF